MSPRAVATHLLAAVTGASICGALWWQAHTDDATTVARMKRRLTVLTQDNERLRGLVEKGQRSQKLESDKVLREGIEKAVVQIRGLEFKQPVDYNVLSRDEIKAVVSKKLAEVYSEKEFNDMSAAFQRLGLLPQNYPLRESYIDLLGEQIAAFYDQHQHKLFMFEDASLENSQNRVVLAHELAHALQDQHFGLKKLPLEIKNNDDRAIASSALVEGEATLVMSEFMLKNLTLGTLKDTFTASMAQNMEQLQKAPRFLRESLVFPYLRGQEFCSVLFARGGYDAISQAYTKPPSSSAQILHPEKYLAEPREEPLPVQWTTTRIDGEKPTQDNVLGEFGARMLLAEYCDGSIAERAAEGWRGDRYLSFGSGEALVWKTLWATPEDASEFYTAHKSVWETRYRPANASQEESSYKADAPRALRMVRKDSAVMIIDAPTADRADQLLQHFGQ